MDFEFSEDQNLLREQAQGFLADNCPASAVRAVLDGDASYDEELWRKIAEMGWTATVIPEEFGGLGLSYLELSVIAEELGRVVAPVPFSSSVYLATEAILAHGSQDQKEKWLPRLATGEVIGTLALSEKSGRPTPSGLSTSADSGKMSGSKIPVADGAAADFAIVVAKSDSGDGASLYIVELEQSAVSRDDVRTLDFSRGHSRLTFDAADAELLGEVNICENPELDGHSNLVCLGYRYFPKLAYFYMNGMASLAKPMSFCGDDRKNCKEAKYS